MNDLDFVRLIVAAIGGAMGWLVVKTFQEDRRIERARREARKRVSGDLAESRLDRALRRRA